jgi:hypothetical protein
MFPLDTHITAVPTVIDRAPTSKDHPIVVHAFVDFWNFHISMARWRTRFRLDWSRLGPWLAEQAGACGLDPDERRRLRYGGLHIYVSHNRTALKDDGLRQWARNVLTRFDGVEVVVHVEVRDETIRIISAGRLDPKERRRLEHG